MVCWNEACHRHADYKDSMHYFLNLGELPTSNCQSKLTKLAVAMVTLAGLTFVALLAVGRVGVQMVKVTSCNQGVVLRGEVVNNELVTLTPELVEGAGVATEPRESLLTDRRVDTAKSPIQTRMHAGRACAPLVVTFLCVPLVNDVVLELLKLRSGLALLLVLADAVHDKGVALLVQPQHLLERSRHHSIIFWIDLATDADNPLGPWVNDHEPSMVEALVLVLFALLLAVLLAALALLRRGGTHLRENLLVAISNKFCYKVPLCRGVFVSVKVIRILRKRWFRHLVLDDDLLVHVDFLELLDGHEIEKSVVMLFVKLHHDILRTKCLFV